MQLHRHRFSVTADAHDPGLLRLRGDLDAASAAALERAGSTALDAGHTHLVLDCAALPFLDSSGLRAIVRLHAHATDLGGEVRLVHVNKLIEAVLRVSGLEVLGQPA